MVDDEGAAMMPEGGGPRGQLQKEGCQLFGGVICEDGDVDVLVGEAGFCTEGKSYDRSRGNRIKIALWFNIRPWNLN